jgi:transposase-like protein
VGTKKGPAASSERERFWRKLVAGQSQSGVSIREWCDRHGVSEPSFYFWRRELARRREQRQGASPQIVPLEVAPPAAGSHWDVEIELPGQIVVRIGPGCNPDLLRQALALLRDGGPEAEPC